jgi:GNAT superfamily N-acetyltransferase
MIRDETFSQKDLPRELEIQVLAFMRLEWGNALFAGEDRFRDRLWDHADAVHFVRTAGNLLISHAQVLNVVAIGDDLEINLAGVSAVMTYPPFRQQGHSSAVMRRVGEHILASDVVAGLLFTDQDLETFYSRLGWRSVNVGRILVQSREPEDLVMLFGDEAGLPNIVQLDWQW